MAMRRPRWRSAIDSEAIGQFLFPLPEIPVRTPDTTTVPGADYYKVTAIQGEHDFGLRRFDGTPFTNPRTGKPVMTTTTWGYNLPYLGSTIVASRDRKVVVDYVNGLADKAGKPLPHLLTVDTTLDGADNGAPEVRLVPHLHGGHTEAASDGNPNFWYTADPKAKANGIGGPAGNTVRYTYDNDQAAAMLWFHDHAMGITRLNVYAGLAAVYLLRDPVEAALNLPSGGYEVPLVIQDRSFNDDGSLAYGRYPLFNPYTHEPLVDPEGSPMYSSGPENFSNTITVNGIVWPYLEVEPRKYRFRVLNGSDSRFYDLWLEETGVGRLSGLEMHQVGNEGGLLPQTVVLGGGMPAGPPPRRHLRNLVLAPAERADLVIDFSALAGKSITLRNAGAAPFPSGDEYHYNANTTGKVMQFRVTKPLLASDASALPAAPLAEVPLPAPSNARIVDLQELVDIYDIFDASSARLELRLNGLRFGDPTTEKPKLDTVEDWYIVNTTMDTHPMHLHLVTFEVVEKGTYDQEGYRRAEAGVMGTMAPGGFHPDTDLEGHSPSDPEFDAAYSVLPNERGRKDTVRVPPGGYVRIRARFDRLGEYMWHCHILAHEDHSMMRPFEVVP